MKMVKRLLCLLMAALMCASLAACGGDDGSLQQYLEENGISEDELQSLLASYSDVVGDPNGGDGGLDISDYVTDGSDVLPEVFIGYWEVTGIYQYAIASDVSDEEALNREHSSGVFLDYNSFSRYGESVTNAVFDVNDKATYAEMEAFGIQTATLKTNYGEDAKITSVAIKSGSGAACTTIYLINNEVLVAFGAGMNVYTYKYLDSAVG